MYRHFTRGERYEVCEQLSDKSSKKEIARRLGKHISSVSRELSYSKSQKGYRPKKTHELASSRQATKPRPVYFTAKIRVQVETWLRQVFSPEQIVGRADHEGIPMVSHEHLSTYLGG